MKALLFLLVLACGNAWAAPLEALLARADLWELKADDFGKEFVAEYREEAATKPFRWVSAAHDSARAAQPGLLLFALPVVETVGRFEGGKLAQVTAVLYARGDAGELSREKYEALLRAGIAALDKATGAKMAVRGKDATNAVRADGLLWQTAAAHYLLEYSFTKEVKTRGIPFRAEFVKLEITPPPKKAGLLSGAPPTAGGKFNATAHVDRKAANGDVVITDVPMVDQGQKGYCVVACAERVMRYYAVPVDANELAQVANSDAERGTNPTVMLQAMKKLGGRLRVRVRQMEGLEVKELLELVDDYNRAAKKAGKPLIPSQGGMIDVGEIYHAMDAETLKGVRTKNKADLSRFQRDVQSHIDTGIPLLWSVMLGVVKEPEIPQAEGGHMRLIIGYNLKTQELLYTDSWGQGHEKKRMPMVDGWAITTGLATIEPL